jgi:hypothetical protein
MNKEPTRPESDRSDSKGDEFEVVPEGTFAGTRKRPVEVKQGEPIPDDTGDQGAGQN